MAKACICWIPRTAYCTSKMPFDASIHVIIDAVDSALMLWIAPAKSAFSTDQ